MELLVGLRLGHGNGFCLSLTGATALSLVFRVTPMDSASLPSGQSLLLGQKSWQELHAFPEMENTSCSKPPGHEIVVVTNCEL